MTETQGNASTIDWFFEPGNFRPMARLEGGHLAYLVNDHLGTPKEVISGKGSLLWSADHETWGTLRTRRGTGATEAETGDFWVEPTSFEGNLALAATTSPEMTFCPIRFQGQWEDAETGLFYNRFRYYEPSDGHYISHDPIGIYGGSQPVQYALNPANWVDRYGLANCWVAKHDDIFVSPNGGPIFGVTHLFQGDGVLNTVVIELTGSRGTDFSNANYAAGLPRGGTPDGFTWHHVDDFDPETGRATMQLVKSNIHQDTLPHDGSVAQYQAATGTVYETDAARMASQCCRTRARINRKYCRG